MENRSHSGLDHPNVRRRLRPAGSFSYTRPVGHYKGRVSDTVPVPTKTLEPSDSKETNNLKRVPRSKPQKVKLPHLPRQSRSEVLQRQMVKASSKKFRPPKRRKSLKPAVTGVLMLVLLASGGVTTYSLFKNEHSLAPIAKVLGKTEADDGITDQLPSEEAPHNITAYKVADNVPRTLRIEKTQAHARVQTVGIGANNVLKSPSNVHDIGWYVGSAGPGEDGTIVLNGYTSGPTKRGALFGIDRLKEGDKLQLERGDGKIFHYTIHATELIDNDKFDMKKVSVTSVPGKRGLNIMTVGGRFNIATNKYEKRIVVFATQD